MINKINLFCILIYFHSFVHIPAIGNNNNTNTKKLLNNDNDSAIDNIFADDLEKYDYADRLTEEEAESNHLKCTKKGYTRNPNDCSKFYRCVKPNKNDDKLKVYEYSCPTGLIFDETNEICGWPSLMEPCIGSGEIVKANRKRFVCPSYGYFQDKENCEYFYYCSNFGKTHSLQPYEFKCPFDLGFDEEKLLCNWKWLVKGCGVVNPDEPEMKRLAQLYEYKIDSFGSQPNNNNNADKFSKRAGIADVKRTNDDSDERLARNYANQQEITKPLKQQMSELIKNIGQRIKTVLWDNIKIQSRNDKPTALSWINNLNPFSKNSKQSQRTERNRFAHSNRGNRQSEPYISIPIISIRPDTDMTQFTNKNSAQQQFIDQLHYHSALTKPSIGKQRRNRIYFPTKEVRDNAKASSQTLNSFIPIHPMPDIIPIPVLTVNNKAEAIRYHNNALNYNKRPQHERKATRTPLHTSSPKTNLKHVNNNFKASLESLPAFNLALNQPLYLETLEQIDIPQSLKQQISFQTIAEQLNKEHNINKYNKFVTHNQQNVFHIMDEEIILDNNKKVTDNRNKKQSKPINYNIQQSFVQSDTNPLHIESHIAYEWTNEKQKPKLNDPQIRANEKKKQKVLKFPDFEHISESQNPVTFSNLNSNRQHQSSHQQNNKQTQHLPEEQPLKQYSYHVTRAKQQETPITTTTTRTTTTTKKPKSIIYWPNIGNFESVRTSQKQNSNFNLNEQKQVNSDKHRKSQYSEYSSFIPNSYSDSNDPIVTIDNNQFTSPYKYSSSSQLTKSSQNNERDIFDESAANHRQYNSDNQYKFRLPSNPTTKIKIISTTKKPVIYNNNNESKKSQLLIIPVSEEYTKSQKYSHIERLTKEYPNLFPDALSNTKVSTVSYQTVSATTTPTPILKDDYIMVMFNNEERLLSKKNGSSTKLHELIKNKDAKIYNLESENAQTIVALVPKHAEIISNLRKYNYHDSRYSTSAPNEPLVYESVKPQQYPTKSPVIIKLEIPQEKTDLIDNIVQKVKEGLSPTLSQSSSSAKAAKNGNENIAYISPKFETTTNKPRYLNAEQSQFPTLIQKQSSDVTTKHHLFSGFDQMSSEESLKNQYMPQFAPYLANDHKTYTPSTQESVILEQIPVYNGYNLYNQSFPTLSYQLPWYHQIGYNPYYQPYYWSAYPQTQTQIQNQTLYSQNYPLPSINSYQSSQDSYTIKPPLINRDSTTHRWYNSYTTQPTPTPTPSSTPEQYNKEYKQRVEDMFPIYPTIKPIKYNFPSAATTPTPTTTTTTTTTTTIPTTTTTTTTTTQTLKPITSTEYYDYNIENYNNHYYNSVRNSYLSSQSHQNPKPTTNTPEYYDSSNKNSYNEEADNGRNKRKLSEDKPQIQVYIVQGSNEPQLIQSKPVLKDKHEKSDVKLIVIDSSKNVGQPNNQILKENKQNPNTDSVNLESSSTQHQQHVHKSQNIDNRNKYESSTELQFVESVNNYKIQDAIDNHYIENGNTDYDSESDYEHESPLYSETPNTETASQPRHQYLPESKVQILQNLYNSTEIPELNNFTEGFVPETACARAGLFQHPNDCNKYYECFWDSYINRFTLHAFECPVKLAFDSRIVGCGAPYDPTICVQY